MGAVFLGVGLRLLEPWPLKVVLDYVLAANGNTDPVGLPWRDVNTPRLVVILAVAVVLITGLRSVADYCRHIGFALVGNRVITRLRSELFRHLQLLSLNFHHRSKHGDVVVRITSDINLLRDVAVSAVLPLIASVLILVGMFGVMAWLNWKLMLLAVCVFPFCWLTTVRLGNRVHEAARVQRRREGAAGRDSL